MFFGNMFNKFIDIALISTTKSTLKSNKKAKFKKIFFSIFQTLYSDSIEEHHSIKVQVYLIVQHDYDVNDAKKNPNKYIIQ